MSNALFSAAASLSALVDMQDAIAHNLAHVSTTGFKSQKVAIGSFARSMGSANARFPAPRLEQRTDWSQGALTPTASAYDFAIQDAPSANPSFFKLETRDGIRYTRGGPFLPTPDGGLVNVHGDRLVLEGSIPSPDDPIFVDEAGRISQDGRATGARVVMVTLSDPARIAPEGNFRFKANGAVESPSLAIVKSGYLERSNANAVDALVSLVTVSRAFESSARALRTVDEIEQRTSTSS